MRSASHLDQGEFDIRCEWGLRGVQTLAPISDVVVIVDVLVVLDLRRHRHGQRRRGVPLSF